MTNTMPQIPDSMLQSLLELRAADPTYDPEKGGQYVRGAVTQLPFRGAVLPLSSDDLKRAPQGSYTASTRKIYTNGYELQIGTLVYDPLKAATYIITGELDHGTLHTMRSYTAERKGATAPR